MLNSTINTVKKISGLRTIDDLCQYGNKDDSRLQQYCGVSGPELSTIFGADDGAALLVRRGDLTTIKRGDETTVQASYDRWTGGYDVAVWVG